MADRFAILHFLRVQVCIWERMLHVSFLSVSMNIQVQGNNTCDTTSTWYCIVISMIMLFLSPKLSLKYITRLPNQTPHASSLRPKKSNLDIQ